MGYTQRVANDGQYNVVDASTYANIANWIQGKTASNTKSSSIQAKSPPNPDLEPCPKLRWILDTLLARQRYRCAHESLSEDRTKDREEIRRVP